MPAADDRPFYQRASFWTGPFTWGIGLLLAVALGVTWYVIGGLPRDHDKYGEVHVPGQAVLNLPDEEVRLWFENRATRSGDSTSLDDQPDGLEVAVTPASGGGALDVEDVPSWLFSSTSGDRGHEPFGEVDVPSEGDYLVVASASGQPGAKAPPSKGPGAATTEPPDVDEGPAISVGAAAWNPLDSRLLGAVLCGVAVFAAILLLTLPFRFFIRE